MNNLTTTSKLVVRADRRQSVEYASTTLDTNSAFRSRRAAYRFQQLSQVWQQCPQCGGLSLLPPPAAVRVQIPEAAAICADCYSPFMLGTNGQPQLLHLRRSATPATTPTPAAA